MDDFIFISLLKSKIQVETLEDGSTYYLGNNFPYQEHIHLTMTSTGVVLA